MAQARKSKHEQETPVTACCPAVSTGARDIPSENILLGEPTDLEERILNALEILALKLQRGRYEVMPIYERLEQDLEGHREKRALLQRASLLLSERQGSRHIANNYRPS